MSTPYQHLTRLRERAVEVRDTLPIGSVGGEFYTDYIDAIDEALLEVVRPEPEKEEPPVQDVMPQGFAIALFIRDCFDPKNQMAVCS